MALPSRKTAHRIYVAAELQAGRLIVCDDAQANYLGTVLRLASGARVLVFNGRDGEWAAEIALAGKRGMHVKLIEQVRPQIDGPDLYYLFAPLKHARLDYMVQKAAELGVAALQPVLTARTNVDRVNLDRMRANVIEAAEQCGVLRVPEICEPLPLAKVLELWDPARRIVFCDEAAPIANPVAALAGVARGPLAVLIGPEGGFAPEERALLLARPNVTAIGLGPRIMRADTAAVAALALVNAVLGDWA
jgi:16S rRNA (uracil1498-N3)-methyltransferase